MPYIFAGFVVFSYLLGYMLGRFSLRSRQLKRFFGLLDDNQASEKLFFHFLDIITNTRLGANELFYNHLLKQKPHD